MAVLGNANPTLMDAIKASGPDGKIAALVELLSESNEILADMTMLEGNLATGNQTVIRTGIPEPTWRKLYGGVQPQKSDRAKITDAAGMLEAYSEIDKDVADLNGNTAAFRLQEDRAHIEGMSQTMARTLFYGNEKEVPEAFTGLAPRYNDLGAKNGVNIVDAGGTGAANASIWLAAWGPGTVYGFYPKGGKGGLLHEDLGEVTLQDEEKGLYQGYRTHFKWDLGLTVADWRSVARIANIDAARLNDAAYVKELASLMIRAGEMLHVGGGRPVFYVNRQIQTALRIGILERIAGNLSWETVAGKRLMTFDDIPVRRCDQLLSTEARVV